MRFNKGTPCGRRRSFPGRGYLLVSVVGEELPGLIIFFFFGKKYAILEIYREEKENTDWMRHMSCTRAVERRRECTGRRGHACLISLGKRKCALVVSLLVITFFF